MLDGLAPFFCVRLSTVTKYYENKFQYICGMLEEYKK